MSVSGKSLILDPISKIAEIEASIEELNEKFGLKFVLTTEYTLKELNREVRSLESEKEVLIAELKRYHSLFKSKSD